MMSPTKFVYSVAASLVGCGAVIALGFQASAGSQDEPPGDAKPLVALQDAKSRALEDTLNKAVTLAIPNETTLEAALEAIKASIGRHGDGGIAIVVDPAGLQE